MSYFFRTLLKSRGSMLLFLPMLFLYASSYFQRTAVPGTIFNQLQADLNLNAFQIAALGASFVYIYALSQTLVGMLADKYGGARIVTYGGLLFCAGTLTFPLLDSPSELYLCRMLAGLGASTMYLSLVKETDHIFGHKNYAVVMGVVYFVGYGGGLCGTLPFERLIAVFSWKNVLLGSGILSFLLYGLFLLGKRMVPPSGVTPGKLSFAPFLKVLCNPWSWLILYCATVNFAIYFIIQTVFGKKFLEDFTGMSSSGAAACIFALTCVCMTVLFSSSILSRLMRNRRKPLILFSTALCLLNTILMTLAIYFGFNGTVFAVCYLLYAVASGFSVIFSMSEQEVNSPDTMTQATGFINMINYLAVAVFSILVGILLDSFGGQQVNGAVIYSKQAYLTLFLLLMIPAATSFLASFFIPETRGKYLHHSGV